MKLAHRSLFVALLAAVALPAWAASPAVAAAPATRPVVKKPLVWMDHFFQAQKKAQKEEKPMLLYFCASDWDDWTMKLEEEVMQTPLWTDWAAENFILVKFDFPKDTKKQRAEAKNQAEMMKTRFNIARVPTFIFLDPWGEPLARVGYNTARLRDEEAAGQPKAWLDFCKHVLETRPVKEKLVGHPNLWTGVAAVKKSAVPLCILVYTADANSIAQQQREALLSNQLFLRFINRNMEFVQVQWPTDSDQSPAAKYVRDFAAKWKFGPSAIQLVVWSPGGTGELKGIIGAIDPVDAGPLVKRLETMLPTIDYGGGWIEDWKTARALSNQQQKDLIISFVSSDGAEYSKRMQTEIYDQPEFIEYARKNCILLKVDFPADPANQAKQSKELKEQNNMLADMFGIRGYPSVVVLNPKGQKILDGVYKKGGAPVWVATLKKAVATDKDRRTLLSEEIAKDLEKDRR